MISRSDLACIQGSAGLALVKKPFENAGERFTYQLLRMINMLFCWLQNIVAEAHALAAARALVAAARNKLAIPVMSFTEH
jgi:hypothetical protein